jgi:lantibiotic modifying enzyme
MSLQVESETFSLAPTRHREEFIETATALGARVCRDAIWANGRCNWIGPVMELLGGRWRQVHKVFGTEFYGGTSGVAYSLAALYEATGERVFKKTALAAIRHALGASDDIEGATRIGLYSGWFGIALSALKIGELLGDESLREPSFKLIDELARTDPDLSSVDLLAGDAGAIMAFLILREHFRDPDQLTESAIRFGDLLVECAVKSETGWSWGELHKPESGAFGNLTGYSHGAAGIGLALLELYCATGESRFREAGDAAFKYERHWFDPATGNWPDLRPPELSGAPKSDSPSFMNAWCHGAPGIALSRLRAYELLGCESCRDEADTAIKTTIDNLDGNVEMSQMNYSLCHGQGGNCEALIYGAEVLRKPELFARAEQVALHGIATYESSRLPWPCGGPSMLETAGLMLGWAGIAYFYLRVADPQRAPSILILRPRSKY